MKTLRYYDRRTLDLYEADFNDSSEFIEGRRLINGRVSLTEPITYARIEDIPDPARTELQKQAGLSK